MIEIANILNELKERGNYRSLKHDSIGPNVIDLSSNDYMGIAEDFNLRHEFINSVAPRLLDFSSSASRLLSQKQDAFFELEDYLSKLYKREILLFNSGYHANTGIVSALGTLPNILIVADKLVHASIIDGIMLSRAEFLRFRHNDFAHLRKILNEKSPKYSTILVITESVFSMDGDKSDLIELCQIKKEYQNVILYVDEAHAFGVFGHQGLGLAEETATINNIDIIVGTFGKAAASSGAFVATTPLLKEFLINKARSLIFSTAIPPICCAWTKWVIEHLVSMQKQRQHLASISKQFYSHLNKLNTKVKSESQIIPLVIGDSAKTILCSEQLKKLGFLALPIRTPTVPAGTERIRFSLNANLTDDLITNLISAINHIL